MEHYNRGGRPRRNDNGTAAQNEQEALTLQAEGQLELAERRCREAMRKARAEEMAGVLLTLAGIHLDLGKHEQAREEAVQAFERMAEEDADAERVRALCMVGRSYLEAGEHNAARPLLERAWGMCRLCGLDDTRVLELLGSASREAGHLDEAEEYYRKALASAERLHGRDSGEAARVCQRLALLAEGWEQGDRMEEFALRAWEIRCGVFGSTSPITAAAQTGLGLVWEAMGKTQEAGEKLLHALAIFDRHYACEHGDFSIGVEMLRDYAVCRRVAAGYLIAAGRRGDAREFSERAQAVMERVLGRRHPLARKWRRDHEGICKAAGRGRQKPVRYNAWDWWRSLSFGG